MDILPHFGNTSFQIKWFIVLYIATIIPCWITLFLALRALSHKRLAVFISWSFALVVLLSLPYGFVLFNAANVSWQLWIAIIILVVFSYYKLIISNNNNKETYEWFWNWYARSYDILLKFSPYVVLIKEIVAEVRLNGKNSINVLEIGCGTGNIAWEISKLSNVEYLGLDSSQKMLDIARKKLSGSNFLFVKKDLDNEQLFSEKKFDVVIMNNVLYALKDYKKIIAQLGSSLKQDSKIIISEPLRQSSLGSITAGFLKKDGLRGVLQIMLHLPSFVVLMVANIIITRIKHIKKQNFFGKGELDEVLTNSGLSVIGSKQVYEGQNIMLIAVPGKT